MQIPFKKQYFSLNRIEIIKQNLLDNYAYLSQVATGQIAPVLKSNAYGHGIVQVATLLDRVGAPFFCVDSLYEAYQLLQARVQTPILITGYVDPRNLRVKRLPFSYAVYEYTMLEAIKKYQPHAGVHIFVDTGMHREGISIEQLQKFTQVIKETKLKIEGLMSHFGMADVPNSKGTKEQVVNFLKAKAILKKSAIEPQYMHIAASSGVLHANKYPLDLGNMSRVGLALYGVDPEGKNMFLKPVLVLKSTIVQLKHIKRGDKVGYDFTFTSKKNMKIAVLPIGYNDGMNRGLSNKGFVKIGKTFCPIIGRVSMNITTIDVSKLQNPRVGDEVVVYSNVQKDKNSIAATVKLCAPVSYELLAQLHASTKRVVT